MVNLNSCPLCQQKNFQRVFKKGRRQIVRCLNDNLVVVNPKPTREEIARLYSPKYFRSLNPYLKDHQAHLKYFRQKLDQIEKRIKKGSLLDVGCGWGFLLSEAQKRGWSALGIDLSYSAVASCRRQGLKVKQGTLKTAKLPSRNFTVITSFQTIEHVTNPLVHLQEIYRLLKPGGLLVMTTPNYDSWTRILMGENWFGYRHQEHLFFLNPAVVRLLLEQAGYGKIEIRRDDQRVFSLSYYLTRLAGFYPTNIVKTASDVVKRVLGNLPLPILTDPWGDILVFAWK